MTVVGSIAIMAAVIIGTLLGVTGMMPCGGGVGIIAGSATVITVASGVVGASVGLIRMACPGVGVRTVMVGMMAIAGRVLVAGHGVNRECK